ncbi:MAG TPA: hypothetical protein VFA22_09815 [Stellaceae bacterium]|nr:hypothetical protein [Stellaceae bacterium]
MTRTVAIALLLAAATAMTGACTPQQGSVNSAAYAPSGPYDEETNPFCGALGNCASLSNVPQPLRGNPGW